MNYLQFVEKNNARVEIGWILEVPNDLSRDDVLKAIIGRKGKWIEDTGLYATCSNCKENLYQAIEYKFCPNCGAEMGGEE